MSARARDLHIANRVVHTYTDQLAKVALNFCVGHTLAPLGLDLPPVVAAIPTERFVVRRRVVDIGFHLAGDTYVDIEEITGGHRADLYQVLLRAAILAEERRRPVDVVVLYTNRVRQAPETLDCGALRLRVRNVCGADIDGDAVLAAAQAKVAAGVGLQGDDVMAVAFLGIMRHTQRSLAAALREGLKLAATLPTEREREGCGAAVVLLGQRRLAAEEVAELVEVFAVAAPRLQDVLERIGREKGRAEGVLRALRRRCGEPAAPVVQRVSSERDLATLDRWLDLALTCASLEGFVREAFGPEQ